MIVWDDEASGFSDRIFGALIALFFSLLTFFLAPILLLAKFWAKASVLKLLGTSVVFRELISTPFFVWIFLVSLLALVYGAYSGTLRTITMLSHIWGTSGDDELTTKIWVIFIVCFIFSLFLMV